MTDPIEPGIVIIYGPPNTLKTSAAMSWPQKVELFDFDLGAHRGAVEITDRTKDDGETKTKLIFGRQMEERGLIKVHRFPLPIKSVTKRWSRLEGFSEAWQDFTTKFYEACNRDTCKAIVLDTGTLQWNLSTDGFLQEIQDQQIASGKAGPAPDYPLLRKQLGPFEYKEPNARQRMIYNTAKSYGKWLIITAHESDELVPVMMMGQPVSNDDGSQKMIKTGRKVPDGFKYNEGLADWAFVTSNVNKGTDEVPIWKPKARMMKSAMGVDLNGMSLNWLRYDGLVDLLKRMGRI